MPCVLQFLQIQRVHANKKSLFRVQPIVFEQYLLFYLLFYVKIEICFLYKGVSYLRELEVPCNFVKIIIQRDLYNKKEKLIKQYEYN